MERRFPGGQAKPEVARMLNIQASGGRTVADFAAIIYDYEGRHLLLPGISMDTASSNSMGTHAFCHSLSSLPSGEVQLGAQQTDAGHGRKFECPRWAAGSAACAASV
jgi:hypothetical protein